MAAPTSASALSAVDEALAGVELGEGYGIEQSFAAAEADLGEPRALAHQDRKGARADLGIERAVIAVLDLVEAAGAVDDHPGEDIEPTGRAFRIGGGRKPRRQRHALDQRHDIDAAGLQHRAVAEVDLVQLEVVDALGDRRMRPRQKTRAHPESNVGQSEIQARRLDLIGRERLGGQDHAVGRKRGDHPVRQDAFVVDREGERHGGSDTEDGGPMTTRRSGDGSKGGRLSVRRPRACLARGMLTHLRAVWSVVRRLTHRCLDGKTGSAYEPAYPVVI